MYTKKIMLYFLILISSFTLIACEEFDVIKDDYQLILEKIEIDLNNNTSLQEVETNLILPKAVETTIAYDEIAWTSSHPNVLDANGVVNRQTSDVAVVLAVTVTINGVAKEKLFHITVKGLNNSDIENWTVVFDANGGSLIASQNVLNGEKALKPEDPTKQGYRFSGWLYEGVIFNFNTSITSNITLIAEWEVLPTEKSYLVKFDTNGGSIINDQLVYENRLLDVTTPTRNNDQFVGWFKDYTLKDPWILDKDVVTENITLYAKWEIAEIPFIPGRTLLFNDEFNGNSLDMNKWEFQNGTGREFGLWWWGNDEKQYYKPENTEVSDGTLKIHAKIESTYDPLANTTMQYSSSKIVTSGKHSQTFGRIEARLRAPIGPGFWPAFWMMPQDSVYGGWPHSGEIDIVELRGRVPNQASSAFHFQASWGHHYLYGNYDFPTGQTIDQFNVYAVEWTLGRLDFSVNGHVYHSRSSGWHNHPKPFDQDFFIIINLAIGGHFDDHVTPKVDDFPAFLEVDYVRAYAGL